MKKLWPRGMLLGLSLALILAGGVALVQAQDFPLGDRSFADQVVGFGPGTDTEFPYDNPQAAIGPEDECGENAVALGFGGTLTVKFTDNYLIDVDGDDLYVFECGPAVEPFQVEISKDGSDWIDLGTVTGQPTSLDIHDVVAPGDKFSYVRITDANAEGSGRPFGGADITAVGAIGAEERADTDGDGVTATPVTPAATPWPTPGTRTATVTPAIGPRWTPAPTKAPTPAPTATEAWASACASGETNIGDASIFRRAKFTIGGTEPREIRITSPAENFAIVKEYGGLVYQKIDGQGWGTLTLEPGSYILSCSGSGYLGLMRATVCIQYPVVAEGPTGPEQGGVPEVEHPPEPPLGDIAKPALPLGPIERIIVRARGNLVDKALLMEIGTEQLFDAWGVDDAWREGGDDHIKSVTADDWDVSNPFIGSIDKDGLFKAEAEGEVTIKATVDNLKGGVFRITVVVVPPITFTGCVKLYDEDNKPFNPSGVQVGLTASFFESRQDYDQRGHHVTFNYFANTDARGKFVLVVPAEVDHSFLGRWSWHIDPHLLPRTPPGFRWDYKSTTVSGQDAYSNQIGDVYDLIEPGSHNAVAVEGFGCFKLWLEELPASVFIDGQVTHDRKEVENARVRLFDNGRVEAEAQSNGIGKFTLYVDNLPQGRYRLTAQCKPDSRGGIFDCTPPGRKGGYVTLHDWLINRQDVWVDLPLATESKTINIEMISWANKIGYTLP